MVNILLRWIVYALIIVFVSWIIPGIEVDNFISAMLVCIIMALINTFIKPFLQIITLPVTIITFGLFTFVINALMLMLAGWIAPGFEVEGFVSALLGSLLLSLLSITAWLKEKHRRYYSNAEDREKKRHHGKQYDVDQFFLA